MTREPVLMRVDGTRAMGWEHLARTMVFASALQRRRRPCHFLSDLQPTILAGQIKRGDNQWIPAEHPVGTPEDLEQLAREVHRIKPAAVLVDSPHGTPEYLAELANLGPMVISFDHQAEYRFASQLIVHPAMNKSVADYDVCPGTQVLAGKRYTLVRPGIRRVRLVRGQEPQLPIRVVVGFGDDPHNWTGRALDILLGMNDVARVDILARSVHPELPQWQKLAETHKGRITIATETAEMAKRISRCHFALCDANQWAYELACVGVPMLLIVQDEAQWRAAEMLEEEGAATLLGWHESVNPKTVRMAVENLIEDQSERRMMARCGRLLIDGRGPDRLVNALEIMLQAQRRTVRREAA